ncbi:MAG: thiamine phosphate synthase [Acidobacteria bacterium]|nr:thiamine phosphate synthase [Acidobacteriota bacterium]
MTLLPRFYPILDTGALERWALDPVAAAETLLSAGARIVQFRHKGHYSRSVFQQAESVAALCRAAGATFVVNDRADIALLLGAALHVGQDDLPPAEARRLIGSEHMLGFSTHNEAQLRAGEGEPVDYLAIGPLFATTSKERSDPEVGLAGLARARRVTARPLVAIGGITRATAPAVFAAGADSIAVIGDLLPDIKERTEEWIRVTR